MFHCFNNKINLNTTFSKLKMFTYKPYTKLQLIIHAVDSQNNNDSSLLNEKLVSIGAIWKPRPIKGNPPGWVINHKKEYLLSDLLKKLNEESILESLKTKAKPIRTQRKYRCASASSDSDDAHDIKTPPVNEPLLEYCKEFTETPDQSDSESDMDNFPHPDKDQYENMLGTMQANSGNESRYIKSNDFRSPNRHGFDELPHNYKEQIRSLQHEVNLLKKQLSRPH